MADPRQSRESRQGHIGRTAYRHCHMRQIWPWKWLIPCSVFKSTYKRCKCTSLNVLKTFIVRRQQLLFCMADSRLCDLQKSHGPCRLSDAQ
eukprot:scaffold200722_cov22-Prasinocladus_malaysianus.AAC.1